MKKIILLFLLPIICFSAVKYSNPKPTFDNPRKWLILLNSSDLESVNHTLGSIYNVLREYPDQSINIAVVAYANGVRALKKDYDAKTLSRISSLIEYDVEFISCLNTMNTMKWKKKEFIEDISYVQTGIAEAIERKVSGWIEVTPY